MLRRCFHIFTQHNPRLVRVVTEYGPETLDFSFFPQPEYDVDIVQVTQDTFEEQVAALPKSCVVINLIDNVDDHDGHVSGHTAIHTYEQHGLPYTGASVQNFSTMKTSLKKPGVQTPKFVRIANRASKKMQSELDDLMFPLIVKPETDFGGSTFIKKDTFVRSMAQLHSVVKSFPCRHMIVEEFIEGREYTCVAHETLKKSQGPHVFDPLEVLFPTGEIFQHEELKWQLDKSKEIKYGDVRPEDAQVKDAIIETVKEAWRILGHDGYIRYDIRVRGSGPGLVNRSDCYIIDANAYCSLYCQPDCMHEADTIIKKSETTDHLHFTQYLIKLAIRRETKRKKKLMREVAKELKKEKKRLAKVCESTTGAEGGGDRGSSENASVPPPTDS